MAALSDNMRGALLMVGSMSAFALNDACMKALAGELPLMQAMFLRGLVVTLCLFVYLRVSGGLRLHMSRRDGWLVTTRVLAEAGAAYFFLTALYHMPFANLSAILQALPLTVSLAAAIFLGEAVGWRRMSAILIGFGGVMLIVRPGGDGFTIWSLYGLATVALATLRDIATRQLSSNVSSMSVAMLSSLAVMGLAAVGSVSVDWQPISLISAAKIAGASFFVLFAYLFSVMVMRVGEIGFVAPFRYSSLLVSLILGYVIFSEWPDVLTLLGAAIVVATGIFTLWRERMAQRSGHEVHKT